MKVHCWKTEVKLPLILLLENHLCLLSNRIAYPWNMYQDNVRRISKHTENSLHIAFGNIKQNHN